MDHLTTIYSGVGENYRMYKRWRHACLAGSLAIVCVVIYASEKLASGPTLSLLCFAGGVAELLLLQIDRKARELFNIAIDTGVALEAELIAADLPQGRSKNDRLGCYTSLGATRERSTWAWSHSRCLTLICSLAAAGLVAAAMIPLI